MSSPLDYMKISHGHCNCNLKFPKSVKFISLRKHDRRLFWSCIILLVSSITVWHYTMFRPFSRPIVSKSRNISAFYVRYSRTQSVGLTMCILPPLLGSRKGILTTYLGLKYAYNRHWIKINKNRKLRSLNSMMHLWTMTWFSWRPRSWTIQLMMNRMMIVLMKIYISPIETLYHYSRNLINCFLI